MKFDKTMMEIAKIWAKESYCKKMQVGSVIAIDEHIISHGHNGTISGHENICEETEKYPQNNFDIHGDNIQCSNCSGSGCPICNGHGELKRLNKTNQFTLHSEANAILHAAKQGYKTNNATIYITTSPCVNCSKLIAQSGIKRVVYLNEYKDTSGLDYLVQCEIQVQKYSDLNLDS